VTVAHFAPSRAYQPHLDVRFVPGRVPRWAQPLVAGQPPNSACWLTVLPRRAGKTWLASAVAHARPAGTTHRVDLRHSPAVLRRVGLQCLVGGKGPPQITGGVVLVDEPGLAPAGPPGPPAAARRAGGALGAVDPQVLARGLAEVRAAGAVPVVLATPSEHALLLPYLGPDAPKDVVLPPALDAHEVARMAGRAPDWAPDLVDRVRQADASWLETPFLLELVLHVAEDSPRLRADVPALLRATLDEAERRHDYRRQVFNNGLSVDQRTELRTARWRSAGIELPLPGGSALLAQTHVPHDPVVAHHLAEVLRIHHISDLHLGGNLRSTVDAKDHTVVGGHLAALAGAGTPLDSYLNHVRQLAADGLAPHLVVVSGDVVNRPDDAAGAGALAWLAELRTVLAPHRDLRPDDPRIVLVGGNHDVSWERCLEPEPDARHRWFARTFAAYPHPDLHLTNGRERRLFLKYPDIGLRIALLGSAESGGEAAHDEDRARLEAYRAELVRADDDATVRALIQSFERLDPAVVSRTVLDRLTPEAGYVTFAALHHPLSPVPAVEIAPYSGLVNAGQTKRALATAQTALVLHGHTHLAFLAAERLLNPGPPWTLRIAGAATLASAASDEQNGYNEVFLAREGSQHRILIRPVRFDGGQWLAQPGMAFRPGDGDEFPLADLTADTFPGYRAAS